jgi:hypothetical protein
VNRAEEPPTGLFRVCCPKEVELEAICAR